MTADIENLYRTMYTIRRFEEIVLDNYSRGTFPGTTHTSLGQEANAAGVISNLSETDIVVSNHRCHGHFLAYGGDPFALWAELMGNSSGVCGGRGGSQHLQWRNFYSNGVQGGTLPIAVGMALAEKIKGSGALSVVFLGDGTLGEGVVYESLNLASLWQAPILFVVENNRIAQTTPIELALAGNIAARFQAFGIPVESLDTSDVLEITACASALLETIRTELAPRALVLHTYRFGPHSKGDDTRTKEALNKIRQERDPIAIHAARLDDATRRSIEKKVKSMLGSTFNRAMKDPYPEFKDTVL